MPKPPQYSRQNINTPQRRSPSFLQRLGSLDLFNNLLFNRERVYQGLKRLSPARSKEDDNQDRSIKDEESVVQSIEDDDDKVPYKGDSMISFLNVTDMAVSIPKARAGKKAPAKTKPKGRSDLTATRKRNLPAVTKPERASKIQKIVPKANSGKRVNGGASFTDAYMISDSEDEDINLTRPFVTDSLTPPLKTDSSDSETDLKPLPTPTPNPTHTHNVETELLRAKVAHARELEYLRQQLSAAEAKKSISSDKYAADLYDELQAERRRTSDLAWECDHLRRERDAARSCLKSEVELVQQRDEYERLYTEERENGADVLRGMEEEKRERIQKEEEAAIQIQTLSSRLDDAQRENTDLKTENTALRTAVEKHVMAAEPASPARSLSGSQSDTSDAEQRMQNVRKTYVTVKKRYDALHSVAANIATVTRPWDSGSFGEFGGYLRQLRVVLGEHGVEERGVGR